MQYARNKNIIVQIAVYETIQMNSIILFRKRGGNMDVKKRLEEVLVKQGWTKYRLAKECSIPPATISNIFHRGTIPTIATIEAICDTLNITLAEFFTDNEMVELTPELKTFYEGWMYLPPDKKEYLLQTIKYIK